MTFKELDIIAPILKAIEKEGYTTPTPIQAQAIPTLLKGKDLLGCAQTGTGKTAAFSIPIIQHLQLENFNKAGKRIVKCLIVTPTRELAIQIGDSITKYGKYTTIKNTVIFGGVKQGAQVKALDKGVDIIVATPGRLLDLMSQGHISLRDIKYFVLDEADQMLNMGFIHDIKKILAKLPAKRQSLFFSATMPAEIVKLSNEILGDPLKITIQPEQTTAERVDQAVYFVGKKDKIKLLIHLLNNPEITATLVFSRTKHGANKIVKQLISANIQAEAIHGNKSQGARQLALGNFKEGKTKVLVATDIAARGIDIDELSYVVNYDLPNVAETYVHRIGRTGRAGASGMAISFSDGEEKAYLRDIEKLIKQKIEVISDQPYPLSDYAGEPTTEVKRKSKPNKNNKSKHRGQGGSGNSPKSGGNRRSSSDGKKKKFFFSN
jgi:ATP-dependent RNA helicase RhlE